MKSFLTKLAMQLQEFDLAVLTRFYLLTFFLISLFLSTAFFTPYQEGNYIWFLCAIMVLALISRPGFKHKPVVLGALIFAIAFMFSLANELGGLRSIDLIWLIVLTLPILFLIGIGGALVWLLVLQLFFIGLYVLHQSGWMPKLIVHTPNMTIHITVTFLLVVLSIMLVLGLYAKQLAARDQALDEGNQALEEDYRALEKVQRHKDEFVASIGHELRTPMSAILGLNPMLRDAVAQNPEWIAAVDHIRRSTQQLLGVINNVLDYSQLQDGRLFLMPCSFDVRELLNEIKDEFSDRLQTHQIELSIHVAECIPPQLWLDRGRFKQILLNLMDNATKHAPVKSTIDVNMWCHENKIHVEVVDQGPGLPAQVVQRIQNRVNQGIIQIGDLNKGAGLGLYICQELIALHHGELHAHSWSPQGGTVMEFVLPMPTLPVAAHQEWQDELRELKNWPLSFLVVDDEPVNLVVVQKQIAKNMPNAKITTTTHALTVLERLNQESFDVLILDVYMPEISGQELAKQIRQSRPQNGDIIILGLTASSNPDDWNACMQSGMNGVLVKPFDIHMMFNQIHHHMQSLKV